MSEQYALTFVDESEELALQAACDYFVCEAQKLHTQRLPQLDGLFALRAAPEGEGAGTDANFSVSFAPDGVYIEITPANGGAPLDETFVFYVAACWGIRGVDLKTVLAGLRSGERRIRVADAQTPGALDECVMVSVSKDGMYAFAQRFPAGEGGKPMEAQTVHKLVSQAGIAAPVEEKTLAYMLQSPSFNQRYIIAKGRFPVDGEPAKLEYHFATSHDNMPKVIDGDKLDFRVLDLFENVEAGQVLVSKTPAGKGVDGVTVKGKPITAKNGRDYAMPRGKNVLISEDGLQLSAATSGRADIVNGKVVVSNLFETRDIDMSVGNIEFNGDIVVRGHVFSGFVVKAAGNIEVFGNVEAATLEAGGHIVLHQGMHGMDKGVLRAGGDVICKYIERASVYAVGRITADALIHSNIESEEDVTITGKRGIIIGGTVRANSMVAARMMGAVSHVPTIIEVGASPALRARINELEAMCAKQNLELSQMITLMQRRTGSETNENRLLVERARATIYALQQKILEDTEDLERARAKFESSAAGRVHVMDTAHAGVRVTIGSVAYSVLTQIQYATFHLRDGAVTYSSCEYA